MKTTTTVVGAATYGLLHRRNPDNGGLFGRVNATSHDESRDALFELVLYACELRRELRARGADVRVRGPAERERRRSKIIRAEAETIMTTPEPLEGIQAGEVDILHGDTSEGLSPLRARTG